jgi:hypothetical protein
VRCGLQFDPDAVEHAIFDTACGGADASLSFERLEYTFDNPNGASSLDKAVRVFATTGAGAERRTRSSSKRAVKTIVVSKTAPEFLAAVLE